MAIIYKYEVPRDSFSFVLDLPSVKKFLKVDFQRGELKLWVLHELNGTKQQKKFMIFGTGQVIPSEYSYIDTWQDGVYVWHLFVSIV